MEQISALQKLTLLLKSYIYIILGPDDMTSNQCHDYFKVVRLMNEHFMLPQPIVIWHTDTDTYTHLHTHTHTTQCQSTSISALLLFSYHSHIIMIFIKTQDAGTFNLRLSWSWSSGVLFRDGTFLKVAPNLNRLFSVITSMESRLPCDSYKNQDISNLYSQS